MILLFLLTISFGLFHYHPPSSPQENSLQDIVESIELENTDIANWSPRIIQRRSGLVLVVPKVILEKPAPGYFKNLKTLVKKGAFSQLLAMIQDENSLQQIAGAYALTIHKEKVFRLSIEQKIQAIQILTKLLKSPTSEVVYNAAMALAAFGSVSRLSIDSLNAIVNSDQIDAVRVAAIVAIWRVGEDNISIKSTLTTAAEQPNSEIVRKAAAQALSKLKKTKSVR